MPALTAALVLLFVCYFIVVYGQEELSCLDNNALTVDWYFIYKIPDSVQFAYMDANSNDTTLYIYKNDLNSQSQALAWTMRQIYNEGIYFNWIAYNNQVPSNYIHPSTTNGHTNGVFAYDHSTANGFWLIHSWPQFPNLKLNKYSINSTNTKYAQSFLCINFLNYDVAGNDIFNDIISYQLRFMQPNIYDFHNYDYKQVTNNFTELLNKQWLNDTYFQKFDTWPKKYTFTQFARSSNWNGDLYEDLVSNTLQHGFLWETNRNISNGEADIQPSFCKPDYQYDEVNVVDIKLSDGTTWNYTNDNAKIGIMDTTDGDEYVCIGGIDRMYSQQQMGGGTACVNNSKLWTALSSVFVTTDSC